MLDRWKRESGAYIDAGAERQPRARDGDVAAPNDCLPLEWSRLPGLSGSLVVLALLTAPNADAADCAHATERYRAAVAAVGTAMHSYESCIAASVMQRDCAAEIQALDDAHDNFADAVANARGCQ